MPVGGLSFRKIKLKKTTSLMEGRDVKDQLQTAAA
jgi:hypothetical protein